MNNYALRALPQDWDELITKGIALSILQQDDETGIISATQLGSWDYIGEIHEPTGETEIVDDVEQPVMVPITDEHGTAYLHANLLTPFDILKEVQQQMPEELANISKFFILDSVTGLARLPAQPRRVWL